MNLAGAEVRTGNVLLLASMLDGDELAAKLDRAVKNGNSIAALSIDDRRQIVNVLTPDAPAGLTELRDVLVKQLKKHTDREKHDRQMRLLEQARARREHEVH